MYDVYETPAIHVLKTCAENTYTTRELLRALRQNHNKSYQALKELRNSGFIRFLVQDSRRGRPPRTVALTQLGIEYLTGYAKLQAKRIRLSDSDIRKAIELANLTESLVESTINPYDRLLEMNEIALSIRSPP